MSVINWICINRFPFVKIIQDICISVYFKYKQAVFNKANTLCILFANHFSNFLNNTLYNISVSNSLISFSITVLVSEGGI